MQSSPDDADAVGVAGPPAAALGEQDDRQPERPARSNRRSFLRWFCSPCVPASTV